MLKKLEIHGFKSFADKTALTFPAGITAVVGPNGSGKSNVVDAVRWVLGEQSAKHIRAGSSTDVLFNGAGQKAAGGFASVSLEFDNAAKTFPVDFGQVLISRKVYRDGASEYAINKKSARLKDVTHLLAAAKLGVKGMGIVNQGAADIFLRANPVERREMLEEMMGLKEFRLKKEEAERRIRETRDNLSKVEDIMRELEPNLRSLKRQVQKWESRAEKETELRELETEYFSRKIADLEREFSRKAESVFDISGAEQEIAGLRSRIQEGAHTLSRLEEERPSDGEAHARIRETMRRAEEKRSEASRQLGVIEGKLQAFILFSRDPAAADAGKLAAKLNEVRSQLESFESFSDLAPLRQAIKSLASNIRDFLESPKQDVRRGSEEELLQQEKQRLAGDVEACSGELARLSSELELFAKTSQEQSQALRDTVKAMEVMRSALQEKETALEHAKFAHERKALKQEDLAMKLREAGYAWDAFVAEHKTRIAESGGGGGTGVPFEELETRLIRIRRDLALIGEIDQEVVRSYRETSERHAFLAGQKQDLDAALEDLDGLNRSLEEKIRVGFEEALREIDREFDRFFKIIFDGGTASVGVVKIAEESLADGIPAAEGGEEDVKNKKTEGGSRKGDNVELGVDFSVHLPRKKVKSLEMLSGGERSLTAIALLFAIITAAQPPLLVLDEIDAALDETNSQKFAKLLKEMTKRVQFIIITHNRSIMESADVLYGVTMQDGVSKVFSLRFQEAEELASQDKTN